MQFRYAVFKLTKTRSLTSPGPGGFLRRRSAPTVIPLGGGRWGPQCSKAEKKIMEKKKKITKEADQN